MTTQTLIDAMSTSSWWPEAAGTVRLNQELAMAAMPNPSPCEEVVDAARKASTNKPITSSMTAAPRITDASADDILAASINVRAEMDTLVAVSAPPRKSAVVQESPNKRAIPVPRTNGTMTPPSATRNATPLALRMRSMSVSSPAMNIRTKAADLREERQGARRLSTREDLEMQQVDRSGAERHAHEQLAEDGRDSPALADRGGDLHRRQQDGHQQRELKSGWHRPLTVCHGEILAPSPPPEAAQTAQQRKGALIAAALDSLSQHRPDRRGLAACQLRLREVLRQQGCLPRVLLRLLADAQPHPQLAHLQMSDEAVGREPHSFAQLFQRFLHFQIHAERHPEQDAKLRDLGVRRNAFAKISDQLSSLALPE